MSDRTVLCVGRVTHRRKDGHLIRTMTVTAVGEESGVPVTVSMLRAKGPMTGEKWSTPAFDLGEFGFYATPNALSSRHRVLTALLDPNAEVALTEAEALAVAVEHDARAGIPGWERVE